MVNMVGYNTQYMPHDNGNITIRSHCVSLFLNNNLLLVYAQLHVPYLYVLLFCFVFMGNIPFSLKGAIPDFFFPSIVGDKTVLSFNIL